MPKGGHAHSGPPKDPNSGRSERIGYKVTALPNEGYAGKVPDLTDYLPEVTARHLSIWTELWSTPQACAWSLERWRWPVVADLVMLRVRADDPESPAGLATSIRQLRDDLGLSDAGMRAKGWSIAADQLAEKRTEKPTAEESEGGERPKRERRLR